MWRSPNSSSQRNERLEAAAAAYAQVFALSRDPYPGVNAAALLLWAGRDAEARRTAEAVLAACKADDYYGLATQAEAQLILGNVAAARALIGRAAAVRPVDTQARAATRRQLRRTCRQLGLDEGILAPLAPASVIHYVGHLIGRHFKESDEPAAARAIREALAERNVGYGYGSLAAGADVLFAEALLRAGPSCRHPFRAQRVPRGLGGARGRAWRLDASRLASSARAAW